MELPIYTAHFSPLGSAYTNVSHYFGIPGRDSPPEHSESDNSMEAEVARAADTLKIKRTQEEALFEWAGEITVNLDEEKVFSSGHISTEQRENQFCDRSDNFVKDQQIFPHQLEQDQNEKNNSQFSRFNKRLRPQQFSDRNNMTKNQDFGEAAGPVEDLGRFCGDRERSTNIESNRFRKVANEVSENGPSSSGEMDMDMYLEGSGERGQSSGNAVQAGAVGARKRKSDVSAAWQADKRPLVGVVGQRDMLGSNRMSSTWPVEDLDIDLTGELSSGSYNMSDALLSLPVFKQEAPSPTGGGTRDPTTPPRGSTAWMSRHHNMLPGTMGMSTNNVNAANCSPDQNTNTNNNMVQITNTNGNTQQHQQQGLNHSSQQQQNSNAQMCLQSGLNSQQNQNLSNNTQTGVSFQNQLQDGANMGGSNTTANNIMEVANGLMMLSPHGSIEGYSNTNCNVKPNIQTTVEITNSQDNRFQYVLAAATSIATKSTEDTLTYLNQCQSYEIKLKKLGDLSHYRGKILKSIIRICFHERRLQFAEREQMALWQSERPGERIVEVDVPLSYGLIHVCQPTEQPLFNTVELYWDPVKEAGVYIKVNCISTEFTAKKHGGEKGVPFRIQVETFLPAEGPPGTSGLTKTEPQVSSGCGTAQDKRLHAAACQIKVFKLKGADRKHKQDREKIFRRPQSERYKYQPSYECTVFTDLPSDAVFLPMSGLTQPYSPEHSGGSGGAPARPSAPSSASPPRVEHGLHQLVLPTQLNEVKLQQTLSRVNSHGSSLDCDEELVCRAGLPISPDSPLDHCEVQLGCLTESSTAAETKAWLSRNRFAEHISTFANFSGADLMRLSRDDLTQICNLADGIRLYYALHSERAPARLTLYARRAGEKPYSALYLRSCHAAELKRKLLPLLQDGINGTMCDITTVFVAGPNGIRVHLTDEVIHNFKNDSLFRLEPVDGGVLMKPA